MSLSRVPDWLAWLLGWILLPSLVGCNDADPKNAVYVDMATAVVATESSVPVPSHKCKTCNDTGWITHGDGHKTTCPDCSQGSGPQKVGGVIDTGRDIAAIAHDTRQLLADIKPIPGAIRDAAKALSDGMNKGPSGNVSECRPKLYVFCSNGCGPCCGLKDYLKTGKLASRYEVLLYSTEIDIEAAAMFKVQSVPAVFVVADGLIKKQRVGYSNADEFTRWLDE